MEANRSAVACCTAGWPAPHNRSARRTQRHLLSAAYRVPVATASTRVSGVGHRVSLFPHLEERRSKGPFATHFVLPPAQKAAGRSACPSVVIMDGQSVRTTERGGVRGFDGHKRVKGRKRHILVDTLGMLIASRVEPANMSDRVAGARLLSGLSPLFPRIRTVIADAGYQSRKLARQLLRDEGWELRIVKRNQRAFPDHRSDMDSGTHLCVARSKPAAQQRLRILRTDLRSDDRHCCDSPHDQPAHTGMTFSNKL